jgi:anthranilate phosphoribosyltransferase
VLRELGSEHVMIVHGSDGLDEITLSGDTRVAELKDGVIMDYTLNPADFGLTLAPLSAIRAESADASRAFLLDVLAGEAGPARDIVLLNAGAAIYTAGVAGSLADGVQAAAAAIDSGAARAKLDALVQLSQNID